MALADVAHVRNAIGDQAGALELVRSIVASRRAGKCVAALATTMAKAGCGDLAARIGLTIPNPRWRAQALADAAIAATAAGRRKRVKTLTEQAHDLLANVPDLVAQVGVLVRLAEAMTTSDRPKRAAALLTQAENTITEIEDADQRMQASNLVATTGPGHLLQVDDLGRTRTEAEDRIRFLCDQIQINALDKATVETLTEQAVIEARALANPYQRAQTLGTLARDVAPSSARTDDLIEEATRHADEIADPQRHVEVLQTLALAAAAAGHRKWSQRLGERAESLIPPVIDRHWPVATQSMVVQIAMNAGSHDLAYAIATAIKDPALKAKTLRNLAEAEADACRTDRARTITATIQAPDQTATPSRSTTPTSEPATPAPDLKTLIDDEHLDQAEQRARTIEDTDLRVQAFTSLVAATAAADPDHALLLTDEAVQWASTVEPVYRTALLLATLAKALAAAGLTDRAHTLTTKALALTEDIPTTNDKAKVLTALLCAMALVDDHRRCLDLARALGQRRNSALTDAIETVAEHNPDTVLTLANYITDAAARAKAFVAAARAQNDPATAHTFVTTALRCGSWTEVLTDPTALPPEIVKAVSDYPTRRQSDTYQSTR